MSDEHTRRGQPPMFNAPDVPREQWCETRTQYEAGATLREIAIERGCDPRTIKACILYNDDRLNRKHTPRLIDSQIPAIDRLLASGIFADTPSLRSLARQLLVRLQSLTAYAGSEKTIRDYLLTLPVEQLPVACQKSEKTR